MNQILQMSNYSTEKHLETAFHSQKRKPNRHVKSAHLTYIHIQKLPSRASFRGAKLLTGCIYSLVRALLLFCPRLCRTLDNKGFHAHTHRRHARGAATCSVKFIREQKRRHATLISRARTFGLGLSVERALMYVRSLLLTIIHNGDHIVIATRITCNFAG